MTIPTTMMAAVMTGHGGSDKLEIHTHWPVPKPKSGEALIQVSACGMNNTDINTRIGWYGDNNKNNNNNGESWSGSSIKFPRIQGADVVGYIIDLAEDVEEEWLGQRVIADPVLRDNWHDEDHLMDRSKSGYLGSECDGGFAQYVCLPITNLGRIPPPSSSSSPSPSTVDKEESNNNIMNPNSSSSCSWSDVELATLSCSYTTAENMLYRARVTSDDVIFITGASGGVGSALIQLAKRRGCAVIALTSEDKADAVLEIGPDAILRRGMDDDRWEDVIAEVWSKKKKKKTHDDNNNNNNEEEEEEDVPKPKVTVVADVVGSSSLFDRLMTILDRGGRYIVSGAIAGKKVSVDLSHLYLNDWEYIGSTVTAPHIFSDLLRYVRNNEIKPLLSATFDLRNIHEAQEAFLSKHHVGKMVLVPPPPLSTSSSS